MFEKTIDYARTSLIAAAEAAVDKAGDRLGQVVDNASRTIDQKLDKISLEHHHCAYQPQPGRGILPGRPGGLHV